MSYALWFTTYFAMYGYSTWLPTLYVKLGGLPPSASLAFTSVVGLIQLAAVYVQSATIDRVGRQPWFRPRRASAVSLRRLRWRSSGSFSPPRAGSGGLRDVRARLDRGELFVFVVRVEDAKGRFAIARLRECFGDGERDRTLIAFEFA